MPPHLPPSHILMAVKSILKIHITIPLLVGAWASSRLAVVEVSKHDFNFFLLYIPAIAIATSLSL